MVSILSPTRIPELTSATDLLIPLRLQPFLYTNLDFCQCITIYI